MEGVKLWVSGGPCLLQYGEVAASSNSDSEEFIKIGAAEGKIDPALQRRKIRCVDHRPLSGTQLKLTRGEEAQQRTFYPLFAALFATLFAAGAQRHGVELLRIRAVPCHALGLWICGEGVECLSGVSHDWVLLSERFGCLPPRLA